MRFARSWIRFAVFIFSLIALISITINTPASSNSSRPLHAVLIPKDSNWKYLDDASRDVPGWNQLAFDDTHWTESNGSFEFGTISEDPARPGQAHRVRQNRTIYFRKNFDVSDPYQYKSLTVRLRRDDGAVLYINGVEAIRSNMPGGVVGYDTRAASAVTNPDESQYFEYVMDPSILVSGRNLAAVELHQRTITSQDAVFDLEITASTSVAVTRGPYLQRLSSDRVTIRWRTNYATNSVVQYGKTRYLGSKTTSSTSTTEHIIELRGLSSNTRYYYFLGSTSGPIAGGENYFFQTATSSTIATRIWAVGDSGTANSKAAAVRNAYYNYTGSKYTNVMLMLGDNAYPSGYDSDYQRAVFSFYPTILRQTVLWPTIGNHDTNGATYVTSSLPYFKMFTLPQYAESGGVSSGTERYYSFNYSNIHFVCLDSMTSSTSPTGSMLTWLKNDLANNRKRWIIAFWHHPPYSKGSHNSDTDPELIAMRKNALPILEKYGVDLVLCGHSHSYERSYFIDGAYGYSWQMTSSNFKSKGSGRGSYPYKKAAGSSHAGAVYAVAGSSGEISWGPLNHPAMYISLLNYGSMVIDVNGSYLTARFLRENGGVYDYFTIYKY